MKAKTVISVMVVILFSIAIFPSNHLSVQAQEAVKIKGVLQPGDKGYKHEELHPHYQVLFDQGKCSCSTGECRPTESRPTELGSETGFDIKVDRKWYAIPSRALLQKGAVPPALWVFSAHVCAYGKPVIIECVVLMGGV